MKVTLIEYTGKGNGQWAAADLMIFTKSTRLKMSPGLYDEIKNMPEEKKLDELLYMSNTIPSSWEFVDYVFMIEDVTRAYTHQQVRTRNASYAQQTMRILNVEGFEYITGPSIEENKNLRNLYDHAMRGIDDIYKELIDGGAKIEDARGILPTNICTNIVAKFNLRTLAEISMKRASNRTQDEYREVLQGMVDAVLEVHPWAELFLRNRKHEAAQIIEKHIMNMYVMDEITEIEKITLLKQLDILRG